MKIFIKNNKGYCSITVSEIICLEAKSNCTKFHLSDNRSYLSVKCLKEYEQILEGQFFYRVHRSYLINGKKLNVFENKNNFISLAENIQVPIARRRKFLMPIMMNKRKAI